MLAATNVQPIKIWKACCDVGDPEKEGNEVIGYKNQTIQGLAFRVTVCSTHESDFKGELLKLENN